MPTCLVVVVVVEVAVDQFFQHQGVQTGSKLSRIITVSMKKILIIGFTESIAVCFWSDRRIVLV